MKLSIFLIVAFITIYSNIIGQVPKDYYNVEVKKGQGNTTNNIINYLTLDSVDRALSYCSKKIDRSILLKASEEIKKIYLNTNGGYVIVFDKGYNIFRYRYTNKGIYLLIDFYFNEGDANSKVVKIIIKDKEMLDKEYKEFDPDKLPPPPPNPPKTK